MLADAAVKKAAPREKPYKIADSGGLYLYVTPSGGKLWRMKFEFGGKEKLLTFGPYPDVKLTEARDKRDEARRSIRERVDPSGARRRAVEARETAKAEEARQLSFEQAARIWFEQQRGRWAPVHANDVITSLQRDVFPSLGARAITAIDAPAVLKALRAVEDRGSIETARRLRQRISGVFAYWISEGVVQIDPAAGVGKALKPLPKAGKQPAITDPVEAQGVLVAAEASGASPITKLTSRVLALTQSRPGMVRGVTWDEIEGIDWSDTRFGPELPIRRVPAARMKLVLDLKDEQEFEHLIPLSWQAPIRPRRGRCRPTSPPRSRAWSARWRTGSSRRPAPWATTAPRRCWTASPSTSASCRSTASTRRASRISSTPSSRRSATRWLRRSCRGSGNSSGPARVCARRWSGWPRRWLRSTRRWQSWGPAPPAWASTSTGECGGGGHQRGGCRGGGERHDRGQRARHVGDQHHPGHDRHRREDVRHPNRQGVRGRPVRHRGADERTGQLHGGTDHRPRSERRQPHHPAYQRWRRGHGEQLGDRPVGADDVHRLARGANLAGTDATTVATPAGLAAASVPQALVDAATITPDFATGLNFTATIAGNRTLANPANAQPGDSGVIVVTQDGTGGRALAYGSAWKFSGGPAPLSTAPSAIDLISYLVISPTLIVCTLSQAFA